MADFSKPALASLEALVFSTWSVSAQFRVSQGAWYNWRDRVEEGDLVPPFGVVSVLSESPTEDFGVTCKSYYLTLAVYYVRLTDLSAGEIAGGATKVEDLIYPAVASFRDALITHASAGTFQLIDDPVISLGIDNPANEYFSQNADKFWAGEVRFQILAGETYH